MITIAYSTSDGKVSRTVAVIGLGFTGLPLACLAAGAGLDVIGIDISVDLVNAVVAGRSPNPDVTDDQLRAVAQRMTVGHDHAAVAIADVVYICVPTPLGPDDGPDLGILRRAVRSITPWLAVGATLVLQSTVPVGTTRLVADEVAQSLGRTVGRDLFVGFAPERINPATRDDWRVGNTPRVVGGVDEPSLRRSVAALQEIGIPAVPVSSSEVAEMSKLVENTTRLVNLSLANEIADVCRALSIPVSEVISAAGTKPFAFLPHWPGPGIGGECIPVDPVFLLATQPDGGAELMPITHVARRQATERPVKVADRVLDLVGRGGVTNGLRVLILGVAYKPNIADVRNSPSLAVLRLLRTAGVDVRFCDPLVGRVEVDGVEEHGVDLDELDLSMWNCVVFMTFHDAFSAVVKLQEARCVLDCSSSMPSAPNLHHL